jgi:hypothetical protein
MTSGVYPRSQEHKERVRLSMIRVRARNPQVITCGHPERTKGAVKGLCHSCYQTQWMKAHPDSNSGNGWSKRNPKRALEKARAVSFKKCGITKQQFEQLWEKQSGKCGNSACDSKFPKEMHSRRGHALKIDHDHATGKVRGLLCSSCNVTLGHMKDSPELLTGLLEYLIVNN